MPESAMKIHLLIAEDTMNVRYGLRMRLGLEDDFVILGKAADGRAAIELSVALHPDVVVMDVVMPGLDGISATRILQSEAPGSKVVILSLHDDQSIRAAALEAGAFAFVPKHAPAGGKQRRLRIVDPEGFFFKPQPSATSGDPVWQRIWAHKTLRVFVPSACRPPFDYAGTFGSPQDAGAAFTSPSPNPRHREARRAVAI